MLERNLGGHRALRAHARQRDRKRSQGMAHRIFHSRRFITAVHHAIGALLVIAGPVGIPVGLFHQLTKARRVAFAQKVAGALPAKDVAGRIAPRRATVLAVAGEEVEKQARLTERPGTRTAATAEDIAEELLGALATKKVSLIGCSLVGIARGYRDAIDAKLANGVE